MSADAREQLRQVRTFPSLVRFLRDELDWPIETDDFEALTFDYEPEELGIDADNAAKIDEIKRLRPLVANQPWGIFFLKFEPKQLPVVALRRILAGVVLKKRATASAAEQPKWAEDDLLFISNYGEGYERKISFAHFSKDPAKNDLATLKVIAWDELDTPLHLEHTAGVLVERLAWPSSQDEWDVDTWRDRWRSAFELRHGEVISTSKVLAERLADLARRIRAEIGRVLEIETDEGKVTRLMKAFREALVHDLDADGFADMYAQTIAYGLLSARITNPTADTADGIAAELPLTNPFLKELMETFLHVGGRATTPADGLRIDFDELGVSDVVKLLDAANMEAVVRDFGDRNPLEDPVIHFYELFLKQYDAKARMQRGVFYTPRPVVSYIVHSVDKLLRTEFGLEDGLADVTTWGEMIDRCGELQQPDGTDSNEAFVKILDPATGTGTFLVEAVEVIHGTLTAKWARQGHSADAIDALWNEYVPRDLLPRLYGYELLMAPYAIAHLKLGLKLHETGYRFGSDERARIYLTNALEPPHDFSGQFAFAMPALAHEADAVNAVKRHQRFTVVVGNPPYSSSISNPQWLMSLLEDWKRGLNETKSDLNREEWKFLRFAAHHLEESGAGVLAFIINRDFLDGVAKRKMREQLGETFPLRIAIDLNGDVKGNVSDENVFEIEQGVAITIQCTRHDEHHLYCASIVGTRAEKYADLLAREPIDARLIDTSATAPYYRWVPPLDGPSLPGSAAYVGWFPVNEAFGFKSSGIQTKNDRVCIKYSADEVFQTVQRLAELSPEQARSQLQITDDGAWSLEGAQNDLRSFGVSRDGVRRILYRPFDWRFIYYTHKSNGFLGRPRYDVMRHMLDGTNVGLVFNRQIVGQSISQFGVSRDLICHGTFYLGNKGQDYLAPLYVSEDDLLSRQSSGRRTNITPAFLSSLRVLLGGDAVTLVPEDAFNYIYAVFHSPEYRRLFAEFLKMDFPRVPLTANLQLFRRMADLGGQLVGLHLMESSKINDFVTTYDGPKGPLVGRVGWCDETVWLDVAPGRNVDVGPGSIGFHGVSETVWNFYVGGYQVCHKWLKDRKGRELTEGDIAQYQRIIVALAETTRIMREIDDAIEHCGGWPEAFASG